MLLPHIGWSVYVGQQSFPRWWRGPHLWVLLGSHQPHMAWGTWSVTSASERVSFMSLVWSREGHHSIQRSPQVGESPQACSCCTPACCTGTQTEETRPTCVAHPRAAQAHTQRRSGLLVLHTKVLHRRTTGRGDPACSCCTPVCCTGTHTHTHRGD